MLYQHLCHGAVPLLMNKYKCSFPSLTGALWIQRSKDLILFFSVPTTRPVLCLQFTTGNRSHTVGMGGGREQTGRQREGGRSEEGGGINRTEAGNDKLREQPLIFHFDRLSSVRRQRRWLLCPERRHLLFVMQTSAFLGGGPGGWFLELGSGHPKNEKFMTFYNLYARR